MPEAVEKCVTRILPAIRKQYPSKTPEEQRSIAWGTCTKMYKEGKLTATGEPLEELSLEEKIALLFPRTGDKPGSGPGGNCVCPNCGFKIVHTTNVPCNETPCPKCGATMTRE